MDNKHYRCMACDKYRTRKTAVEVAIWRTPKAASKGSETMNVCKRCANKQKPNETGFSLMQRIGRELGERSM